MVCTGFRGLRLLDIMALSLRSGGSHGQLPEFRRRALESADVRVARSPTSRVISASANGRSISGAGRTEIGRGLIPGLGRSAEGDELAAAKRRIRELEAELAIHRRAAELLAEPPMPAVHPTVASGEVAPRSCELQRDDPVFQRRIARQPIAQGFDLHASQPR
jgi:hypothetical protein